MLIDARSVDDGSSLSCDLCIVGAGPAGITLADRLRDSGMSIYLLESGGFEPELKVQRLYRGKTHGYPYFPLHGCRYRFFGGSANRWGGWCRPLDALDFQNRDWVSEGCWPIGAEDVVPYERDAAKAFRLHTSHFDPGDWRARLPPGLPIEDSGFEHAIFQYSPHGNFGEAFRERILGCERVRTFIHANAFRIIATPGTDTIEGVEVRTLTGRAFEVQAKAVVLAAGGIENARLLLASNDHRPAGVGNEHDLVGRWFMDHLHVPGGHFVPASPFDFGFYGRTTSASVDARGVIVPSASLQRRNRLLGISISIEQSTYDPEILVPGAPA